MKRKGSLAELLSKYTVLEEDYVEPVGNIIGALELANKIGANVHIALLPGRYESISGNSLVMLIPASGKTRYVPRAMSKGLIIDPINGYCVYLEACDSNRKLFRVDNGYRSVVTSQENLVHHLDDIFVGDTHLFALTLK